MTLPSFMDSTISAVIRRGAGLPGISAVVMMISTSLACSANKCHLGLDELVAHDLGIAAFTGAVFIFKIQHQELGVHAFDLFLDLGPGVEGTHDGAHALGGADGSQAGNTGADDQHLGRRYLAGSRDLAGEKASEMLGCLHHGPVARDIRHGTQCVHFLGARDARNAVHGHGRYAAFGQLLEAVRDSVQATGN